MAVKYYIYITCRKSFHRRYLVESHHLAKHVFSLLGQSTGLEVLAKARKISIAGAVVVLASLVLFVISWAAARTAGAWLHLEVAFEKKLVRQYIKTGQVRLLLPCCCDAAAVGVTPYLVVDLYMYFS